jgi:hypothetical protein
LFGDVDMRLTLPFAVDTADFRVNTAAIGPLFARL